MKVGIDVDGVLACFEAKYAPLLTKISGIEFPKLGQPDWPDTWYWDRAAGVTKEQEAEAWKHIKESVDFWYSLPVQPGAVEFLDTLAAKCPPEEVYFITQRMGMWVQDQTAQWLEDHFGWRAPSVIISGQKGSVCKTLGLDLYIDDKIENCMDVRDNAPMTHCYMMAQPWNKEIPGVPRLKTLSEFLDIIKSKWQPTVDARMPGIQALYEKRQQEFADQLEQVMAMFGTAGADSVNLLDPAMKES